MSGRRERPRELPGERVRKECLASNPNPLTFAIQVGAGEPLVIEDLDD